MRFFIKILLNSMIFKTKQCYDFCSLQLKLKQKCFWNNVFIEHKSLFLLKKSSKNISNFLKKSTWSTFQIKCRHCQCQFLNSPKFFVTSRMWKNTKFLVVPLFIVTLFISFALRKYYLIQISDNIFLNFINCLSYKSCTNR